MARCQEREAEGMRHFRTSNSTEKLIFQAATPEDFGDLRDAFAGIPPAQEILDALSTSAHIYQLWRRDNYENNRLRVDYMKRNLVGRLQARERSDAGPGARVLLKFGRYHTGRGLSPVNQLDLGNLTHQLAFVRGGRSLHVWVTALAQRRADGSLADQATPGSALELLAPHVGEGPWTVFDARALRSWFHSGPNREAHPALADAVFQHDLILVTPEFTRSPSLVLEPAGGGTDP